MTFCPNCGKELMATDAFCLNCGAPVAGRFGQAQGANPAAVSTSYRPPRDGWRAVFLSAVLAGLGSLYLGRRNKGRVLLAVSAALLAASLLDAYVLIFYTLFWVYNLADTFVTVQRIPPAMRLPEATARA